MSVNADLLYLLGKSRFESLKAHYLAFGLETGRHGNLKRAPPNTLTHRDKENVVKFITSYARTNSILLPGYKRDDLKLLPSSTTKKVCSNSGMVWQKIHFCLFSWSGLDTKWHAKSLASVWHLTLPSGRSFCHTSLS